MVTFLHPFPYLGRSTGKGPGREGAAVALLVCLAAGSAAAQQTLVRPRASVHSALAQEPRGGRSPEAPRGAGYAEAVALGGRPGR